MKPQEAEIPAMIERNGSRRILGPIAVGLVSAAFILAMVQAKTTTPALAQEHVGVFTPADIIRGEQIYTANCVVCHGLEGASISGVDLRRGIFKNAATDDDIKRVIRTGVPSAGMPPFSNLDDASQTALVAYVRAGFSTQAPTAAGPAGNIGNGKIVVESEKAGCLTCHRINGRGGREGPDLTDVGTTRTAAALYASLTDPTSAMLPINRPVQVVTRDGRTVSGRRVNEDTYTVLISTNEGRLVAFDKASLRSFNITKVSPMPSYKGRLTDQELSDVVAYLVTLKDANTAAANPFIPSPLTSATRPAQGGRR